MSILQAHFVKSSKQIKDLPPANKPEYAFIGRSNVGKSSLINMLTGQKGLAKISSTPGKTKLINHYLINNAWYLTDLPGYGYARTSKSQRDEFQKMIRSYLKARKNLVTTFVLVDSRHMPQKNDMEFMEWLGKNKLPFAIVFTKADKLSSNQLAKQIKAYQTKMLQNWTHMPPYFVSSAKSGLGRKAILDYIEHLNMQLKEHFSTK